LIIKASPVLNSTDMLHFILQLFLFFILCWIVTGVTLYNMPRDDENYWDEDDGW